MMKALFVFFLGLFLPASFAAEGKEKTYYEWLEVPQDASLNDIKKSYRKLALQHHPDRNKGKEKESELIFREISEAYEVLSDEKSRQQYDRQLKYGRASGGGFGNGGRRRAGRANFQFRHRDPFQQFDDLFQNDDFFKSAFKDMEGVFEQMFGESFGGGGGGGGNFNFEFKFSSGSGENRREERRQRRVERNTNGNNGHQRSFGSYTSRSTRTTFVNGRRLTVQTMEKDGNKIEETYDGDTLVKRLVNGQPLALDSSSSGAGSDEF